MDIKPGRSFLHYTAMPGNPIAKAQRITALSERFKVLASDFDGLIPSIYHYTGQEPTGDQRADAWSDADQYVIMATASLRKLSGVLCEYAKRSTVVEGDESDADVNGEVAELAETESD